MLHWNRCLLLLMDFSLQILIFPCCLSRHLYYQDAGWWIRCNKVCSPPCWIFSMRACGICVGKIMDLVFQASKQVKMRGRSQFLPIKETINWKLSSFFLLNWFIIRRKMNDWLVTLLIRQIQMGWDLAWVVWQLSVISYPRFSVCTFDSFYDWVCLIASMFFHLRICPLNTI